MSKEEYDTLTWENFENADNIHLQLYEQYEAEPAEEEKNDENKDKVINEIPASARNNNTDRTYERKGTKARPKLKIISDFKSDKEKSDVNLKDSYYKVDKNFYMYNEEVFFLDQKITSEVCVVCLSKLLKKCKIKKKKKNQYSAYSELQIAASALALAS